MAKNQGSMEMFSLRMDKETIEELERLAQARYLPLRIMIRIWIMERIEKEKEGVTNGQKV